MSVAEISQLHSRYVRLADQFKALWTWNQFASGVFKTFLEQPLPYQIDFQKLYEEIRVIGTMIQSEPSPTVLESLDQAERDVRAVVPVLLLADESVRPSVLRRFIERLKQQDEKIIFNLIKFYLYAGPVTGDRLDKVDFLFTRSGEEYLEESREYRSRDSAEIQQQILSVLSVRKPGTVGEGADETLQTVRQLKDEILKVAGFEELTGRDLLNRIRTFKKEIGERYFLPDVLLAIIDCNVTTKNQFLKLYRKEEQSLLEDSQRVLRNETALTLRFGRSNPEILEEIDRFRRFKEKFDESRASSNIKHSALMQLRTSMNRILGQIDEGFAAASVEGESPAFLRQAERVAEVERIFGSDPVLEDHLVRLISVLGEIDPGMGGEAIARSPRVSELRLEPWEVEAYFQLFGIRSPEAEELDEENEELPLLYLRAAALRIRVDEEARMIASAGVIEDLDAETVQNVRLSLERAKELDQSFGEVLHEGMFSFEPKTLHELYRSRFRLLRGFSGLWLIYDQRVETSAAWI